MRTLLSLLATLLLFGSATAADGPFGWWKGTIGPDVLNLEINVSIEGTEEDPAALLDIPVQGMFNHALTDVAVTGDSVAFTIPGVPGNARFEGTVSGDSITGTFSQSGQEFDFSLERSDDGPASGRPQDPEPPFPYTEEEVTVMSPAGDVTLAGSLLLPEGDGPFPAVVFLTGSGPQDRNEELYGHRPFLVLADALARDGWASLRLDDRGVGGSGGSDADATYEDLIADAVAAADFLTEHADIGTIGFIGHSQGGYLAPEAALESAAEFVISLAGPAVDGLEVLKEQNRLIIESSVPADGSVSSAEVEAAVEEQLAFLDELAGRFRDDDPAGAAGVVREHVTAGLRAQGVPEDELGEIVDAQVEANSSPVMASFVLYDPQPLLREFTLPLLAVYGGLDIQVPAEQSTGPLEDALREAGNTDWEITVVDDMNHLLQPAETGSFEEYPLIETTIHEELFPVLLDWLDAHR